jgi:endonuclease/exonuclease/phosphatase family metal-dependent hydrolase
MFANPTCYLPNRTIGLYTLRTITALLFCLFLQVRSDATAVRVTTWNLEWFPNGKEQETSAENQAARINAAGNVLRLLQPDVILLQEVKDYDACTRLAESVQPHRYQVAICSAFKEPHGHPKQQVAILSTEPAQAAWSEPWKSVSGTDPPRGFTFAWFKIRGADVGIYSVHLKSNLVRRSDKAAEEAKNIRKREVASQQLLDHMRDVIATAMPNVRSIIIGGDFNTNAEEYGNETTLKALHDAGFVNCMRALSASQRVTHPASGRYPDATFDYIFARNARLGAPLIIKSSASDHLPVTCNIEIPVNGTATFAVAAGDQPSVVTIKQAVPIEILYGKTVIPKGLKLPVVRRDAAQVWVRYMDSTYPVPVSSTDLQLTP